MPTTTSSALKPAFLKTVQDLVQQRNNLTGAGIQLLKMWVDFCVTYTKAYDEAKELGPAAVAHLNDRVGISDDPLLSKMRHVARIRHALSSRVLGALPPSREALVDLARAEITKPGTIQRLIDTNKVKPDSTVKEVRAALPKKRSRTTHASKSESGPRVTITFNVNEDAAGLLAHWLLTVNAKIAVPDDRLRDAIKEKVGKERFDEEVSARLTK
jgi:hypothetical protein